MLSFIRKYFLGFFIYATIFATIIYILTRSEQPQFLKNFSMVNEFFTSLVLFIVILFSFLIYLANRNIIPTNYAIHTIKKIPKYVPFNKFLKQTLLNLIDEKYKIIVLLRTLDAHNYQLNLSQIAAFNHLHQQNRLEDLDIEYIFIDNNSSDIDDLITNLDLISTKYIIITSLSSIFKQAILIREALLPHLKKQIKIIGALSSISDRDIQKIIDEDPDIIRIIPPDYDEAKTAMEFLFSKIKSSSCTDKNCSNYFRPSNVIVLHNGTYGAAIANKCKLFFERERSQLYYYTSQAFTPTFINDNINIYTFSFDSGTFINNETKSDTLEQFLPKWKSAKNYFYIVGYEPNITSMLEVLNEALHSSNIHENTFLFCATLSMQNWRQSVIDTLQKQPFLQPYLQNESFYIQLLIESNTIGSAANGTLSLQLFHYNPTFSSKKEPIDLEEEVQKIFSLNKTDTKEFLQKYLSNNNNYISLFSAFSVEVAYYTIKQKVSLLESKAKLLQNYQKLFPHTRSNPIHILVNGDSINQYTIEKLTKE